MTEKSIADHLVARRKALGLSQREVAALADISPDALSKWERGYYRPDDASIGKWANALGCGYRVTRELTEPDTAPPAPSPNISK